VPYVRAFQNCKKVGAMSSIGRVMGQNVHFGPFLAVFGRFWPIFGRFLAGFFAVPKCPM